MPANTTPPSYIPPVTEFGLLRAYLALKAVSQAELELAVGNSISKRTRAEIANQLRTWLTKRPKSIQELKTK